MPHLECEAAIRKLQEDMPDSSFDKMLGRNGVLHVLADPAVFRYRAETEAWLDTMRLGIVIDRYRAEHGTYPERLDAVSGRFPQGMPVDPFSGKGYVYTPDGKACRVSSVFVPDKGERGGVVWEGEVIDEVQPGGEAK
jgi:hypothetical protein